MYLVPSYTTVPQYNKGQYIVQSYYVPQSVAIQTTCTLSHPIPLYHSTTKDSIVQSYYVPQSVGIQTTCTLSHPIPLYHSTTKDSIVQSYYVPQSAGIQTT